MYQEDFLVNLGKQDMATDLTTQNLASKVELVFNFDTVTSPEELSKLEADLASFLKGNGWTPENGFLLERLKCEEGSIIVTIVVVALKGFATGVFSAAGALFFKFLKKKIKNGSLAADSSEDSGLALEEDMAMIEKDKRQYGEIYGINQFPPGLDLPFPAEFFAAPKVVIEQKVTLRTPEGVTRQYTRKVEVIEGKIKRNTISQDEYFE
jgi:hypothetical protein